MTLSGNPYSLPPEVCLGKPYDGKGDVWAIGLVLYELITYKKAFGGVAVQDVMQMITKSAFKPLSNDVDSDLKIIVAAILNKDPDKRPSILQVAKFPAVKYQILAFIDENNIEHEMLEIIDLITTEQGSHSDAKGLGLDTDIKVNRNKVDRGRGKI